jgi:hypothetical protein
VLPQVKGTALMVDSSAPTSPFSRGAICSRRTGSISVPFLLIPGSIGSGQHANTLAELVQNA